MRLAHWRRGRPANPFPPESRHPARRAGVETGAVTERMLRSLLYLSVISKPSGSQK